MALPAELPETEPRAMYTYAGDGNFDGVIDSGDYGILDFNVGTEITGFANGDYNYDGVVDSGDYNLLDQSFEQQGEAIPTSGVAGTGAGAGASLSGVTAVPEPAALSVLGFAAAGIMARRRRAK